MARLPADAVLDELLDHVRAGQSPPLAWVIAHAPDASIRPHWEASTDPESLLDLAMLSGGLPAGFLALARVLAGLERVLGRHGITARPACAQLRAAAEGRQSDPVVRDLLDDALEITRRPYHGRAVPKGLWHAAGALSNALRAVEVRADEPRARGLLRSALTPALKAWPARPAAAARKAVCDAIRDAVPAPPLASLLKPRANPRRRRAARR
jgi:hypothetical protein